jgi:hypothetical protein
MGRNLYRCLVHLHPLAFRRRFEEEMIWIFDEAEETWGVGSLIVSAASSLARQWLMRSGLWKLAAAGIGGTVPLLVGFGSFIPWSNVWRAVYSLF